MQKKLGRPIAFGTPTLLAVFIFVAWGADGVNALYQREKIIFEWEWEHPHIGVKLFALMLVIIGMVTVMIFCWQLHLTRQCRRDLERATNASRDAAIKKRTVLAELTSYHAEPELLRSILEGTA